MMHQLMEGWEVEISEGQRIPLSWYLSEGQTLMDSVTEMEPDGDVRLAQIKEAFRAFEFEGKIHSEVQDMVIELVTDTCRFLSDYNGYIYKADVSETPYFAHYNPTNDILIHAVKPVFEKVRTRDGFRDAIKLGWIGDAFKWQNFKVKPSLLGFKTNGLEIPLDLYITSHALRRLNERINITPGIMHEILVNTFLQYEIAHSFKGNESLVTYRVSDLKVGYFVVRLHEQQLVVHTFLFLTNNHTPEGEKLNRLLNLELADKEYLEIDNLPDFNAYHIDQNEKLSKVFSDAGCASLLKLGHLQAFSVNEINDKDPESILKYLADAKYFTSN
ncbi:MAG: hypothetical protein EOO89_16910 [Pedobacter sp.]|nr:MAG: hypothetical protein EOO89_16910 [Pedobacter sp.]